jgi:membrane protease YdiL (CAAX protease family)
MESVLYDSRTTATMSALGAVTVVPLGEELLFRGVLFGGLAQRMSVHRAALVSAALFSLWHGYGLVGTFCLTVTGYVLARAYQRTHSLLPSIGIHAALNTIAALSNVAMRS